MRKLYLLLLALLFCSLTPPNLWADTVEFQCYPLGKIVSGTTSGTATANYTPYSSITWTDELSSGITGTLSTETSGAAMRAYSSKEYTNILARTASGNASDATYTLKLSNNEKISKIVFYNSSYNSTVNISNGDVVYDSDTKALTITYKDPSSTAEFVLNGKYNSMFYAQKITVTYGEDAGGGDSDPVLSLVTDKFEPQANYEKRENVTWWDYVNNKDNKGDSWNQFAFIGEYADGGYAGKIVVNGENLPEGGRLECTSTYPTDILILNTPHLA